MMRDGPVFFTTSIHLVPKWLLLHFGSRKVLPLQVRVGSFHLPAFGHSLIDTGYDVRPATGSQGPGLHQALYSLLLRP